MRFMNSFDTILEIGKMVDPGSKSLKIEETTKSFFQGYIPLFRPHLSS